MKMIPYVKEKHDGLCSDKEKYFGYVRGDIDKRNQMWTKFFPMRSDYRYGQNYTAFTQFMDWFVEQKYMESVKSLYEYCCDFPQARCEGDDGKAFSFFAEDNSNAYQIRFLCIENNYNFYVNVYQK